jgi:hypothetical protein
MSISPAAGESIVGTIRIRASDRGLMQADAMIRRRSQRLQRRAASDDAGSRVTRPDVTEAARHLELALLTRDHDIRQSGLVRVIW